MYRLQGQAKGCTKTKQISCPEVRNSTIPPSRGLLWLQSWVGALVCSQLGSAWLCPPWNKGLIVCGRCNFRGTEVESIVSFVVSLPKGVTVFASSVISLILFTHLLLRIWKHKTWAKCWYVFKHCGFSNVSTRRTTYLGHQVMFCSTVTLTFSSSCSYWNWYSSIHT